MVNRVKDSGYKEAPSLGGNEQPGGAQIGKRNVKYFLGKNSFYYFGKSRPSK